MLRFDFENAPAAFDSPIKIIEAHALAEVIPALGEIERALESGYYAAGFLSYEAGAAFHKNHAPLLPQRKMPLLWFGIYSEKSLPATPALTIPSEPFTLSNWTPAITYERYKAAIEHIRREIERGATYQVNYTFPLRAHFGGSPLAFYQQLSAAQNARYGAYLDTGRFKIASASPELFFKWNSSAGLITTKPMKGTALRGRTKNEDHAHKEALVQSQKNRAENLMIVDLMRNDLGKIAEKGSVTAEPLFEIETYPTVFQMTSTVSARTTPSTTLTDIFSALFPCGSITGAPKLSTMRIISEIEDAPREVYCGAIGYITPTKEAVFSVPIRTCWIDTQTSIAEYSVGGGITWDSKPEEEYAECFAKAKVLTALASDFQLLESLRLHNGAYTFLDAHIERLARAAEHFRLPFDSEKIKRLLAEHARGHTAGLRKARLLHFKTGEVKIESSETAEITSPQTVSLATQPVISQNDFLYHKTTHRPFYPTTSAANMFSCLYWNERGELTEFATGNLVLEIAGEKLTPPVSCGLLPGVMREDLLRRGEVRECVLQLSDLKRATRVWFINSVRGWVEVRVSEAG